MEFRLATFNMENLGTRPGEATPEILGLLPRRIEALRAMIRRLDADAVAFQELLDENLLDPLLEGLGYPYRVVGDRGDSPLLVGVFSRYPLQSQKPVADDIQKRLVDPKTSFSADIKGALSRPTLSVDWEVPGLPTTLVVIHFKSKIPTSLTPSPKKGTPTPPWSSMGDLGDGRFLSEIKRLAMAVEIRRVIDRHLSLQPDRPLAVLGDFNSALESEVVRIVCGDVRVSKNPELWNAELIPCDLSIPRDLRFSMIYRGEREMIDHILITRSFLPYFVDARVFNEGFQEAVMGWEPDPLRLDSDHAPLVSTFRI